MKNRMKAAMGSSSGFTLIELIMVVVILGTLAAVAVPKFLDLSTDAEIAALNGIAGSLSSASAINYAGCQVGGTQPCTTVTRCIDIANTVEGVTITGTTFETGGNTFTIGGQIPTCTVNDKNQNGPVNFVGHKAP